MQGLGEGIRCACVYECVLQMYALDTYVCVSACSCVHVCAHVPTGTHSRTCMCAGQVLQDAVLGSRVGTWQVSDRRVTTEGRPTLNSAWAARELLEGAGCELRQPGAGPPCWGSLRQPWGARRCPSLGALSLSSCRRKRGPRQDMEPDGMGVSSLVFTGLVGLKGCLWILFPQTAVLSVWCSASPCMWAAGDGAPRLPTPCPCGWTPRVVGAPVMTSLLY